MKKDLSSGVFTCAFLEVWGGTPVTDESGYLAFNDVIFLVIFCLILNLMQLYYYP